VSVQNLIKIGRMFIEILRYLSFFEDGGHLPSWVCGALFRTTQEEYLEMFIVQNLVDIEF